MRERKKPTRQTNKSARPPPRANGRPFIEDILKGISEQDTALLKATVNPDINEALREAKKALGKGADPNVKDSVFDVTPLMIFCITAGLRLSGFNAQVETIYFVLKPFSCRPFKSFT